MRVKSKYSFNTTIDNQFYHFVEGEIYIITEKMYNKLPKDIFEIIKNKSKKEEVE